jgi:hypothetical protein
MTVTTITTRARIWQALEHADVLDRADAIPVTRDALDQIFRCLKCDARFAALDHDAFDLLVADAQARIEHALADLCGNSITLAEIQRVLDLVLGD